MKMPGRKGVERASKKVNPAFAAKRARFGKYRKALGQRTESLASRLHKATGRGR